MQSLCDITSRWVVPAGKDRCVRGFCPVLARDSVSSVAICHSRSRSARAEVRNPFRHRSLHPVPPWSGHGLFHASSRSWVPEVSGRTKPPGYLRPHSLPWVDSVDDGLVRPHLSVPCGPRLARTSAGRHAGPSLTFLAVGCHLDRRALRSCDAELRSVFNVRAGSTLGLLLLCLNSNREVAGSLTLFPPVSSPAAPSIRNQAPMSIPRRVITVWRTG